MLHSAQLSGEGGAVYPKHRGKLFSAVGQVKGGALVLFLHIKQEHGDSSTQSSAGEVGYLAVELPEFVCNAVEHIGEHPAAQGVTGILRYGFKAQKYYRGVLSCNYAHGGGLTL